MLIISIGSCIEYPRTIIINNIFDTAAVLKLNINIHKLILMRKSLPRDGEARLLSSPGSLLVLLILSEASLSFTSSLFDREDKDLFTSVSDFFTSISSERILERDDVVLSGEDRLLNIVKLKLFLLKTPSKYTDFYKNAFQ